MCLEKKQSSLGNKFPFNIHNTPWLQRAILSKVVCKLGNITPFNPSSTYISLESGVQFRGLNTMPLAIKREAFIKVAQ